MADRSVKLDALNVIFKNKERIYEEEQKKQEEAIEKIKEMEKKEQMKVTKEDILYKDEQL